MFFVDTAKISKPNRRTVQPYSVHHLGAPLPRPHPDPQEEKHYSFPMPATNPEPLEVPPTPDAEALLPQLWSRARIEHLQKVLPPGIVVPHCSLSGEDTLPAGRAGDIAVVVCYTKERQATALMSMHLQQWEMTFVESE